MLLARTLILLFLLLVVGLLGVSALWAPDRAPEDLLARYALPPSRFITIDGMRVHYRDEGPAQDSVPLVLLHGTSASLHTWDGWTDALRQDHRVIRMDLPGFGITGPSPTDDYALDRYAQFTLTLLDSLRVTRFTIAGNSLGGEIAWRVAAAAPARVQRLILVDATGYPRISTSVPVGFRIARQPRLAWLTTRILPRSVVAASVRDVYGDPDRVTDSLIERYYLLTLRAGNRAALPQRFAQESPASDSLRIRTLTLPTLILWGALDRLIPPDHADRFARDIAGGRRVIFPGLGHVPHEEDPAGTVAEVRRFLAEPITAPATRVP